LEVEGDKNLKSRKAYKTNRDPQTSSVDVARTNAASNVRDIYNTPCPEITVTSIEGETYDFLNMVGNVIILKFSKFYKRNLKTTYRYAWLSSIWHIICMLVRRELV